MKYIKDNVIINSGDAIIFEGKKYLNPLHETYIMAGWSEYVPEETLNSAITTKLKAIDEYDTSYSVNGFNLNGELMWFDKATRVGLMNSTAILKDSGETNCTLWGYGTSHTIPCDTLIAMLSQLEVYALNCYNVTQQHKQAVQALTSIDEVNAFDITADYPTMLEFTI